MSIKMYSCVGELAAIAAVICILVSIDNSDADPTISKSAGANNMYSDDVQNFLMNYGYLPKSNMETGNLRSEVQLKEAIRSLQRFGHIPETGLIDDATRKLMLRPRCGQPDNPDSTDFSANNLLRSNSKRSKRFVIQGPKWSTTRVTWSMVNESMPSLDIGQVRRVLSEALDVWSRGSVLTFKEVRSSDADIQVLFARRSHGDGYEFDGPGLVLAHAYYPGKGRGGDAHFDADEDWTVEKAQTSGTNLFGVAVHEFGHSIGLGHSSKEDAIMFPWYHGYQTFDELPKDDREAIQQIYGVPKTKSNSHHHGTEIKTTTTTTTTPKATPRRVYYPDPPTRPREYDREQKKRLERERLERERERLERERERLERDRERLEKERQRRIEYELERRKDRRRYTTSTPYVPRPNPTQSAERPRYYPEKPTHHHPSKPSWPTTRRTHRHRSSSMPELPDTCNTDYDAITMIRGELFIFKNRYLWRIGDNGLYEGYPLEITRMWNRLPANFTHVDAVYENKDRKIVFFIGKEYYVFNSNELEYGYPKPLTHLGLPRELKKMDAVLVWGHNNRTYFFSETYYWKFDEDSNRVELDYPRPMTIWQGIGYYIDSAFQYKDGKSYFFKGKSFWKLDDASMKVTGRPHSSAHRWMGCPRLTSNTNEVYENDLGRKAPLIASAQSHRFSILLVIGAASIVWIIN